MGRGFDLASIHNYENMDISVIIVFVIMGGIFYALLNMLFRHKHEYVKKMWFMDDDGNYMETWKCKHCNKKRIITNL